VWPSQKKPTGRRGEKDFLQENLFAIRPEKTYAGHQKKKVVKERSSTIAHQAEASSPQIGNPTRPSSEEKAQRMMRWEPSPPQRKKGKKGEYQKSQDINRSTRANNHSNYNAQIFTMGEKTVYKIYRGGRRISYLKGTSRFICLFFVILGSRWRKPAAKNQSEGKKVIARLEKGRNKGEGKGGKKDFLKSDTAIGEKPTEEEGRGDEWVCVLDKILKGGNREQLREKREKISRWSCQKGSKWC